MHVYVFDKLFFQFDLIWLPFQATLKYIGWAPSDLESQDHPCDIPEAVKNDQNCKSFA